jgi:hypothetical protein
VRPISAKNRKAIAADPYYRTCARLSGECSGRITIEHVFIYAGRQIDELWNLIPLCIFHHLGEGLDKKMNQRLALYRASYEDLAKFPRFDWAQYKRYLGIHIV